MMRFRACSSKRVCTLLNSHRINKGSSRNVQQVNVGNYQHDSQSQRSRVNWGNLVAAGIIAASTSDTTVDTTSEDATKENPEETTPLPVDPAPPQRVLDYLDSLYDSQQFKELSYSLRRYEDLNNAELLWRRARAHWEILELEGKRGKTTELQTAVDLIDRAIDLDPSNSNAHRWKAILSNALTSTMGMRYQFQNLETMKYHLKQAVELNPKDGTALTLLGTWHVELLELSWYEKKFATTFLGELPGCSYEEALELFLRAEEVSPKGWNRNLFLIAKVYLSLGDRWKSKEYAELVLDQEVVTDDDKIVLEEAEKFYRKHFVLSL